MIDKDIRDIVCIGINTLENMPEELADVDAPYIYLLPLRPVDSETTDVCFCFSSFRDLHTPFTSEELDIERMKYFLSKNKPACLGEEWTELMVPYEYGETFIKESMKLQYIADHIYKIHLDSPCCYKKFSQKISYRGLCRRFLSELNLEENEPLLDDFTTVGDLFTRKFCDGAEPLDSEQLERINERNSSIREKREVFLVDMRQ